MLELSEERKALLGTEGHILVMGGPGSGKTTIALLKADNCISQKVLKKHQKILFLSFARATVNQVEQVARKFISKDCMASVEINTYHGFAWSLLKGQSYLMNGQKLVRLITPSEASVRFAGINAATRTAEIVKLFHEEGVLHFDLFAEKAADLLFGSKTLAQIICSAYPIIILDEFQDTNLPEWGLIQILGQRSTLVALADPEQRIYEFRGADPKRIDQFVDKFKPRIFDFGAENNRSGGTDIAIFGDDLMRKENIGKKYQHVKIIQYTPRRNIDFKFELKTQVLAAISRLRKSRGELWSMALLVPANALMMDVSAYLGGEQVFANGSRRLPIISHDVAFDTAGPILAATVIAGLLEGAHNEQTLTRRVVESLHDHIRGRKGSGVPSQSDLALSLALKGYLDTGKIRGSARTKVVEECRRIALAVMQLEFSGSPDSDWLTIRKLLEASVCEQIQKVGFDARLLRLLNRGSVFRNQLGELWRKGLTYEGARSVLRGALVQEQLSTTAKSLGGLHVMTIHKAKGKEFDEVLVFEGMYSGRIVSKDEKGVDDLRARRNLRVAVTRARVLATIMTPSNNPCTLIF